MSPLSEPQDPPVSVKAALWASDGWVLVKNDRDEWELPGGRIDRDDQTLADTLRRECREELGVDVTVGELVAAWLFEVVPGRRVTVVCYAATLADPSAASSLVVSDEHLDVRIVPLGALDALALPGGYAQALRRAASMRTDPAQS